MKVLSIYAGMNDSVIWDFQNDGRKLNPAPIQRNYPLMAVKIDDRLMNFEIMGCRRQNKMVLNLIRTNEAWAPQISSKIFKFWVPERVHSIFSKLIKNGSF